MHTPRCSTRLLRLVFVTLLVCLPLWETPGTTAEKIAVQKVDGKIEWIYSYQAGKQQARQTGKPLFVVFRCER
tara:strand:+ start:525 stop:743 length:219 start_codon:yes stop_codon:yes gene_type:complete